MQYIMISYIYIMMQTTPSGLYKAWTLWSVFWKFHGRDSILVRYFT